MAWNFFSKERENSSPYIYGLVEEASGISKQLIDAALNGDSSAQQAIQQWAEYQQIRSQNAEAVYSTLTQGTDATAVIAQAESQFLQSARTSLGLIADAWSQNRIADQEIQQTVEVIGARTQNALSLGAIAHQKALTTMGLQHRANLKLLDITAQAQARAISGEVAEAQVGTLPGGKVLLALGKRLSKWIDKVVGN
jgi:hypothetical protein